MDTKILSLALEMKRRTWECAFCGSPDVKYQAFPTAKGYQVAECNFCGAVAGVERKESGETYLYWSKERMPLHGNRSVQKAQETLDESLAGEIIEALV